MDNFGLKSWLLLFLLAATPGKAEKLAFVVGNAGYLELPRLENTISDAQAYSETFESLGYNVSYFQDLDLDAMGSALDIFLSRVRPGDDVAFVFSGHGWSDGQTNYLIATDAPASGAERKLKRETLALRNGRNGILDDIEGTGAGLVVAIIDACRNNPFLPPQGRRSVGQTRGLARVTAPSGTFVIFSAGEGQEALDRLPSDGTDQKLSVFSRNLIPRLKPGVYLEDAISEAQIDTARMALSDNGHLQHPAYYDQTLGKTCLAGSCGSGTSETDAVPVQCTALYAEARDSRDCDIQRSFIEDCALHPRASEIAAKFTLCMSDRLAAEFSRSRQDLATAENATDGAPDLADDALQGSAEVLFLAAEDLMRGGASGSDAVEAAKQYRASADKGHREAQASLGYLYDTGTGVPRDHTRAFAWYLPAAEQGQADAQNNLGLLYARGLGVETDFDAALDWFRRASDQGHAAAQYHMGILYEYGLGVAQDPGRAAAFYYAATKSGSDLVIDADPATWDPATQAAVQRLLQKSGHLSANRDSISTAATIEALRKLKAEQ